MGNRFGRSFNVLGALSVATTLVLAACDSDQSTAPEAEIVNRIGSMETLIASGPGLLQAATARGDSAGQEIAIARIEVRGRADDSVVR